ncbi:Guanine nucleotide exchange factor for Cdc42p [Polyrhizophydium stewartii]|uniref:Guanine nucleotide exchange factor for Cdc42p n=1 Tax=Polyrhizophydium stewartii TaxID=2732419 RepID=A0ABR4N913_9FUNG
MEIARPVQVSGPASAPVSLFQQTMGLIEKLYSLPGFEHYLFPEGIEALADGGPPDPIPVLFGCFRLGAPLCALYNQMQPARVLDVPDVDVKTTQYTNVSKKAVYHFLVALKDDMGLPEDQLFSLSDLYKDDTNGLVKAMKTVNTVIEAIERRNLMPPTRPLPFAVSLSIENPTDNRARVIVELLETERAYIHSLQELLAYENELLSSNAVNKDIVYKIFANLPDLLDFQRRFLISMEATLAQPPNDQKIGALFLNNEDNFSIYEPMCGNYNVACQLAMDNAESLMRVPRIDPVRGLQGYLIKPVQRICKYPLLLNELVKLSSPDSYPLYDELVQGMESIKRVTERVNETKRVEENKGIKQEMVERVEDWKGLRPDDFGNLLLTDKFVMVSNDVEKEYSLFLFERMFLCLKESKKKRKRNGPEEVVYTIKGNIHISSIGRVDDTSDPSLGFFELVVHWRDIGEMETFPLKCRNQEQATLWKTRLDLLLTSERQRRKSVSEARSNEIAARFNGLSVLAATPEPDMPDAADSSFDEPKRSHSLYHSNSSATDLKSVSRKSSPALPRGLPVERRPSELMPRTSSIGGVSASVTGRPARAPSAAGLPPKSPGVSGPNEFSYGFPPPPPIPATPPVPSTPLGDEQRRKSSAAIDPAPSPEPQSPTVPSAKAAAERAAARQAAMAMGMANMQSSGQFAFMMPMSPKKKTSVKKKDDKSDAPESPTVSTFSTASTAASSSIPPPSTTPQPVPGEYIPSPPVSMPGSPGPYLHRSESSTSVSRLQTDLRSMPPQQALPPPPPGSSSQGSPRPPAMPLPPLPPNGQPRGSSPMPVDPVQLQQLQQMQQQMYQQQQHYQLHPQFQQYQMQTVDQYSQQYQQQQYQQPPQMAGYQPYPTQQPGYGTPPPQFQPSVQQQMQYQQLQQAVGRHRRSNSITDANGSTSETSTPPSARPPPPNMALPPPPNMALPPPPPNMALPPVPSTPNGAAPSGPPPAMALPPPPTPVGASSNGISATPPSAAPSSRTFDERVGFQGQPPSSAQSRVLSPPGRGTAGGAAPLIKIKTYYNEDVILIAVPSRGTTYRDLVTKITRKIRLNNAPLPEGREIRLRYRDEEGDYVTMNGDDDVTMAFELARSGSDRGNLVHIVAQ